MISGATLIDVWNFDTFDAELRGELNANAELIRSYFLTSTRQWLEREASDHTMPYPHNPYSGGFIRVIERIMGLMEERTIRTWHYTRMTDDEVGTLQRNGIYLSTLDTIRGRLDAQVSQGAFDQEIADKLFADSPFQRQLASRSKKFWMVSHPICIKDGGVQPLLNSWGGEATYFWQRAPEIQALLMRIGRPRVLELAMPLSYSKHGYSAAEAVVATYGRTLGCRPDRTAFDLYTHQPLGPEHVLTVHSEGDDTFSALACGYPAGYVEVGFAEPSDE